jgi:hypothetical protein
MFVIMELHYGIQGKREDHFGSHDEHGLKSERLEMK